MHGQLFNEHEKKIEVHEKKFDVHENKFDVHEKKIEGRFARANTHHNIPIINTLRAATTKKEAVVTEKDYDYDKTSTP